MSHGHAPEPDIDEVRGRLEQTRHLRLALDVLEETLPGSYASDGLLAELWALREKFAAAELPRSAGSGSVSTWSSSRWPPPPPRRWRPGQPRPSESSMNSGS